MRLVLARPRNRSRRRRLTELLAEPVPGDNFRGALHYIEHHPVHLSSAFHVSPFEEAVIVSVDGFGDFAGAAWGVGRRNEIDIAGRVYFPHSLGIVYEALTHYLGFP
jgi:carbamoyltransferase